MIQGKSIRVIAAVSMTAAALLTLLLLVCPSRLGIAEKTGGEPAYEASLFDPDKILTVDIQVSQADWNSMLENATDETYISCDVTVNGTTYRDVGLRPKGNSSLTQVANSDSDRYSFKLEFDHYVDGQTCRGLDKLVLNNIQSDATYMKEYLSYDLLTYMGVTTPLSQYASITVNGEDWGFYLALESLEESFALREYGDSYGQLYKPDSMGNPDNGQDQNQMQGNLDFPAGQNGQNAGADGKAGGNLPGNQNDNAAGNQNDNAAGNQNGGQNNNAAGGNPGGNAPAAAGGGADRDAGVQSDSGSTLRYTDDQASSYSDIFNNAVFDATDADYARVIEALKHLNDGTDLERYIDVDEVLRYFAVNTALVNLDSYLGSTHHNYYLYEAGGQLSILPWDYNLSFAGFQSASASEAVNFPVDTPVSGTELSQRPLLAKLLEVDEYRARYHSYLKQIAEEYFGSGYFDARIDELDVKIGGYVQTDATAFVTYEAYQNSLPVLRLFGQLRAESILGQLDGSIPSTADGQEAQPGKRIDASGLVLSALGTAGGGGGNGQGGGLQAGRDQADAVGGGQPGKAAANQNAGPDGGRGAAVGAGVNRAEGAGSGGRTFHAVLGLVCAAALAAGILFVRFFPRRKYRA